MKLQNSILEDIRLAVGLSKDSTDFDTELLMHINTSISTLHQNGVGSIVTVDGTEQKWIELQDPLQIEGNKYFGIVPAFVALNVKMLFDPPPPSTVEYYSNTVDQYLWRLKTAYENFTSPIVLEDDY